MSTEEIKKLTEQVSKMEQSVNRLNQLLEKNKMHTEALTGFNDQTLALASAPLIPPIAQYAYAHAKKSHTAYAADPRSWKVYGTADLLKGFIFEADKISLYTSRKYFLLPGIKPASGDPEDFSGLQLTLMVLGLREEDGEFEIIRNADGNPIVYEYLDPCPGGPKPVKNINTYFP